MERLLSEMQALCCLQFFSVLIFGDTYMTTGLDQLDDDQRGDCDGDGDDDDDDEKSEQEQNKSCLNFWNQSRFFNLRLTSVVCRFGGIVLWRLGPHMNKLVRFAFCKALSILIDLLFGIFCE